MVRPIDDPNREMEPSMETLCCDDPNESETVASFPCCPCIARGPTDRFWILPAATTARSTMAAEARRGHAEDFEIGEERKSSRV